MLATSLAGLLYDLLPPFGFAHSGGRLTMLLATASLLIATWIGLPRFSDTDIILVLIVAALVPGGALVLL